MKRQRKCPRRSWRFDSKQSSPARWSSIEQFEHGYPALTFASGPTNSLRGASRLTGEKSAIVVDIGGTTSDIGVLGEGFPREANVEVEVGGCAPISACRTPMPWALGAAASYRPTARPLARYRSATGCAKKQTGHHHHGGDELIA